MSLGLGVQRQQLIDVRQPPAVSISKPRGCSVCPRDGVPGIAKIKGTVHGRSVFVWGQSPGPQENSQLRELVGPSGEWFWKEMRRAGFRRSECDIQNVVRCLPANRRDGRWVLRNPTPAELRCCSLYSDQARALSKARIWLVLGKIAAKALFGSRKSTDYVIRDGRTAVFLLDHPAYFLRGAPPAALPRFRKFLRLARAELDGKYSAEGYLRDVRIRTAATGEEAVRAYRRIAEIQRETGERMALDEESDIVDGERRTLCVGFCPRPGDVWVFLLDHPGNDAPESDRNAVRAVVRRLLLLPGGKTMHHGSYDDERFERVFGTRARGFDYDTQFGSYIADPVHQSYSLLNITARDYPEYTAYKNLVMPEAVGPGQTLKQGRESGNFHLARVPLEKVVPMNAMDCHVTKLIERDTRSQVSQPLVHVYTDASFVLERMRRFGPLLDFTQTARVEQLYPVLQKQIRDKLRKLSGNPRLNPNAQAQVKKLVYEQWRIPPLNSRKDTRKETLEILQQEHSHKGLDLLQEYRQAKTRAERVAAFRRSAEAHDGRVTTFWWLTGTRTGRLSSGGGKRHDKRNLGNLQNIPSSKPVKNMLVSDLCWMEFVKTALRHGTAAAMQRHPDTEVFLARDYSQMELRVLAQVSGEEAMIRLFNAGRDIHAAIGEQWSSWDFRTIQTDSKIRRTVKALHFGVIYGLTAAGLHAMLKAQGVRLRKREVAGYINQYWTRFRQVSKYRDRQPRFARTHGYVQNLFRFRTPVSHGGGGRASWKNQAVNAPIQGAAHQVLLCALALLWRHPKRYALIRPQMEIHDSLVSVARLRDVPAAVKTGRRLLEKDVRKMTRKEFGISWRVPLVTDIQIGFRFGGLVELEDDLEAAMHEVVRRTVLDDREMDASLWIPYRR